MGVRYLDRIDSICSSFLSVTLEIFSIVRMFAVAGRDGLLPTVSGFVHYKRLTPVVPIIIEGTLGKVHLLMFR